MKERETVVCPIRNKGYLLCKVDAASFKMMCDVEYANIKMMCDVEYANIKMMCDVEYANTEQALVSLLDFRRPEIVQPKTKLQVVLK